MAPRLTKPGTGKGESSHHSLVRKACPALHALAKLVLEGSVGGAADAKPFGVGGLSSDRVLEFEGMLLDAKVKIVGELEQAAAASDEAAISEGGSGQQGHAHLSGTRELKLSAGAEATINEMGDFIQGEAGAVARPSPQDILLLLLSRVVDDEMKELREAEQPQPPAHRPPRSDEDALGMGPDSPEETMMLDLSANFICAPPETREKMLRLLSTSMEDAVDGYLREAAPEAEGGKGLPVSGCIVQIGSTVDLLLSAHLIVNSMN